jgi:ATPase family protein associated with various cellular activities (AAA)
MAEATLTVSGDLSSRAARLARVVADVIDLRCRPESGGRDASGFLRDWADSVPSVLLAGERTPLELLSVGFGLGPDERDLLVLAGLAEEHEGIAATLRSLHPRGEPYPTASLAALVLALDRAALRGLLRDAPVSRHGLVQAVGTGPLFERSLVLADALWDVLHGWDAWPGQLERVTAEPPTGLGPWLADAAVRPAIRTLAAGSPVTVLVRCPDEAIGLGRISALAAAAGSTPLIARARPDDAAALRLLAAHAAARGSIAVLVPQVEGEQQAQQLLAVDELPVPLAVCSPGGLRTAADRPLLNVPAGPVEVAGTRIAWQAALPELDPARLAARHPLDPAQIAQIALDARQTMASDGQSQLDLAAVSKLVRARAGVTLPAGVDLITPNVAWQQLVLPDESAWQLRDAVGRLEQQSIVLDDWGMRDSAHATRGARLLLTGPPGTGKSLAAHAIATAIATDLLVVDVSRVVSKWLGETEKNLAAVFDAAERTQSVLFLDEADALFGARTEISDSHDRYANVETAYLLQRFDRFDGLAVLATNLRQNIDPAFLRRMDFVVDFPMPDAAGRAELWALHLPPAVRADDVDLPALARLYAVPGGWIRNAAIAAAFVAAALGERIAQRHLVGAMRREYAKACLTFPGEPPRRRHE